MTTKMIMFLLSMTFFITVIKLRYWRPLQVWRDLSLDADSSFYNPAEKALCPVTGYRCADEKHCDCATICGSNDFERVRVAGDHFILSTIRRQEPGVYCFPKGWDRILTYTHSLVYTSNGWSTVSNSPHIWNDKGQRVACASPYAVDNSLNVLFDRKEGREVKLEDSVTDWNEQYQGEFRYQCQCGSKDIRNNAMISIPQHFPFACLTDHCKTEVYAAGFPGWNGTACDCGTRNVHLNPNDDTSPCVKIPDRQWNQKYELTYAMPCIDKNSYTNDGYFYCPDSFHTDAPNEVYFKKIITKGISDPYEVLKRTYDLYESI